MSCQELADDLRRWQEGEAVSVRSLNPFERATRWVRKNPAVAGLSAASLLVVGLVAVAVGFAAQAGTARVKAERAQAEAVSTRDQLAVQVKEVETARNLAENAKSEAVTACDAEEQQRKLAVKERERFERSEYGRTLQVAHQEWRVGRVTEAFDLLNRTRADLRGWEWGYLHRLCRAKVLFVRGHTGAVNSASFSPDGSRVVTGSGDNTARICDARTGAEVLALRGHTGSVLSASFSPDGSRVVTAGSDATVRVWDADSGAEVLTLKGYYNTIVSASFSRDGSRIVTASSNTAKVWDERPFTTDLGTREKK